MDSLLFPQPGEQYYHYKHDPIIDEVNYCYTVIALGYDTVGDTRTVIYEPCYEDSFLSSIGATQYVRSLDNFIEHVVWPDGITRPRFIKRNKN